MTLSEEDWNVVRHRVEAMPSHIKLAIGRHEPLSKSDMINHIERRDEIGKRIVTMQMNYLKFFKKDMAALLNE